MLEALTRALRREAPQPAARRRRAGRDDAAAADDPAAPECGWYESTHDLARGLQVTEHASPEALAHALPLEDWLRLWLDAPAAAAGLCAARH